MEVPTISTFIDSKDLLKKFLTPEKVTKQLNKDENILYYWIYELISMPTSVKKDELDSIIEGKKMDSGETLGTKIR